MAHHNSSTMIAVLSDAASPLGARLRRALEENRWTVTVPDPGGDSLPAADVLVLSDLHGKGPEAERQARIAAWVAAAGAAGIPRIVLLGSVDVYHPRAVAAGQVRETAPLQDPAGASDAVRAALVAEELVRAATGTEPVILRIPTLHDRTDPDALAELRAWMLDGGADAVDRVFQRLHPDDLALAVQAASRRAEAVGQVFNIAEPMAVAPAVLANELARLGRLLTDPEATEDRVRPEYDLSLPVFATDKASRLLEFRPRRTLWTGLAECAQAIIAGMRAEGRLPTTSRNCRR